MVAHDLDLLGDLGAEIRLVALGLVGENAQGRFQGMGQIADLRAGPVDDFGAGQDEQVQFVGHGLHFVGKLPFQALGLAGADGG